MVCAEHDIADYIPDPEGGLTPFEESVKFALAGAREDELRTRWSRPYDDAAPSRPLPTDPEWSGGSLYQDVREHRSDATLKFLARNRVERHRVRSAPTAAGQRLVGVGAARVAGQLPGKTGPPQCTATPSTQFRCGAERVECRADRSAASVTVRAETGCPAGSGWSCRCMPIGPGAVLRQRVLFQPYGLGGESFWRAAAPFRYAVFNGIARSIIRSAAQFDEPAPGNLSAVRGTGQTVHSDV